MSDKSNDYQENPFKFKFPVSNQSPPPDPSKNSEIEENKKVKQKKEEIFFEDDFPKLKAIHITLPAALHKEYKKYCIENGVAIKDDLVSLIRKAVKKR